MEKEHSYAYNDLVKMVKAVGYEKKDEYSNKTMEEIYDWERDEVEDIIWEKFQRDKDSMLSDLLVKLKKYDGLKALKEAIEEVYIPGPASIMLAKTLYNCTKDIKYLNIFEMNINYNKWDSTNNLSTISALNRCVITEDLYNLFKKLYLKCEDDKADIIDEIITGMLRCKGYITIYYTFNVEEVKRQYTYINKFKVKGLEAKKEIIRKLENRKIKT